ncbi:uncharacterized protein LOC132642372 [Lycium barbarum]|uniref:uncharacterized protein LOC132642372 n=1 Tax=Lycium barbarum TaxID=112863 RepID=UPI00293F7747|nr:uncharacterized protein LOC132642372 [Lycium barbarum]
MGRNGCHDPAPGCECDESTAYVAHLKSQRLLQFLMGLNESYSAIRSNILARKPTVTVNEAYAVATQKESQKELGMVDKNREPLTPFVRRTQDYKPRYGTPCRHCRYKGHPENRCCWLIGYPPDFKSKRKGNDAKGHNDFKPTTNGIKKAEASNSGGQKFGHHFASEEQYQELVNKIEKAVPGEYAANMAGSLQWQGDGDW